MYQQHMFWLRNKKINFLVRTLNLSPGVKHWMDILLALSLLAATFVVCR